MTTKIFEELPKRKHPVVQGGGESAPEASGGGGGESAPAPAPKSEGKPSGEKKEAGATEEAESKRIRQAVYDIRYRARREEIDLRQAFSQYMQNSGLSQAERTAIRGKLFGKEGGGVSEKFSDAGQLVSDNVAEAFQKVFEDAGPEKKYKVRVTDKKTGRSYIRYATRAKITELRSNPNIQSVEMTEHGEPYEGGRTSDPNAPKKAKKDYDGDGKKESSSKEHAGVVHNAIQKKKGGKPDGQDTRKEEFIADASAELESDESQDKEIDVMKGKNTKIVKINPKIGEEYDKKVKEKNEKDPNGNALDTVGCKDPDWRSMKTQRSLRLNKLRAIGLKCGNELEGDTLNEGEKTPAQIAATAKYEKIKKLTNQGKHKEASKLYNENRMTAYTAGAGEGSPAARPTVSKSVADKVGRRSDEAAFKSRKKEGGERKKYDKKMSDKFGDKSRQNKTGRGQPQQYRKSADSPEWEGRFPHGKSNIVQGKGSIKDLKDEYSWLTEEFLNESMDLAVEYFYKQGINEDGLNLIIEEVGIEDFTDFVLDLRQDLNEEREATKAPKRDYEKVKAAVYKKDAARKEKGTGEYSTTKAAKAKYGDEEAPEGKKPVAKPTPAKKVATATVAAKKKQPAKPTSRKGLLGKVRDTVERGVTRHKAAVKKAKGEVKKVGKTLSDTAKQHREHGKKFGAAINPKKEIKAVKGAVKAITSETELEGEPIDEVVGQLVGTAVGAKMIAPQLARVGLKGVAGKIAGGAIGAAAGEVLDPFKKKKDKSPVGAAAGGAVGVAAAPIIKTALAAEHKPEGKTLEEFIKFTDAKKRREALGPQDHTKWKPGVNLNLKKDVDATKDPVGTVKQISNDKLIDPIKTSVSNTIGSIKNAAANAARDAVNKTVSGAKDAVVGAGKAALPVAGAAAAGLATKAVVNKAIGHGKKNEKVKEEVEVIDERLGGKGTSRKAGAAKIHPTSGDWPDSDRGSGNKAATRAGNPPEKKSPTYAAWVKNKRKG